MTLRKLFLAAAAFALTATATHVATASTCPPPRQYSGACIQVIVWAKSPDENLCCQYPTPCSAPAGWTIYYGPGCSNGGIEAL
ncbi:MAG TPA: hypothetical protein VLB76_25000 [Thermoanaerobaculia bacterium]|jgi:hypothetical protein|nr:hypothetical protein [Thermoanaerobaculia bacterium]